VAIDGRAPLAGAWPVHLREEMAPLWPLRLPTLTGADGLMRRRGAVLERLVHVGEEAVLVRAAQPGPERVVIGAWSETEPAAVWAIARMRWMLGVDDDLRDFHERFSRDPWLGRALRADRGLRVTRRPEPFEALAWAVCEQLIDYPRAAAIQRRLVARLGRRCARSGLRDAPTAAAVAAVAPARLQSMDLSAGRALALRRVAREVARGRLDLRASDHEAGWHRLRTIPGIGSWTVEILALHGQGRIDQVPAGDLHLLELVGRLRNGNPQAHATEAQVREHFAPYAPYGGLAAAYARSAPASAPQGPPAVRCPGRGGTRSSAPSRHTAAA
jgi:3-methyladenine DNA glycosylase/8-oxoguanine DNA glycosylase